MERIGVLISLFLIIVAGTLGYVVGGALKAGDLNETLPDNAFFKDCNLQYSHGCAVDHLYLAGFFVVFSIILLAMLNRSSESIFTPILIYYFSLMTGFLLKFLF
jgi:hypothetical protein